MEISVPLLCAHLQQRGADDDHRKNSHSLVKILNTWTQGHLHDINLGANVLLEKQQRLRGEIFQYSENDSWH